MAKPRKSGLGKGLDALFLDNENDESGITSLRLSDIEPNSGQPRKRFDEKALEELADSIREHGVLQPLIVRKVEGGIYQLVAGERRWRASRMAGLMEVPVVVYDLSDEQVMEIALIENLQREDLNPIEEAKGYRNLMDTYTMTQDQVAKRVGKSRPLVANSLRLLSLPEDVLSMVESGEISSGHARALLGAENHDEMRRIAEMIKQGKMSVRDVEQIIQKAKKERLKQTNQQDSTTLPGNWGESYFKEVELALEGEIGRKIKIMPAKGADKGSDKGTIQLPFYSKEELGELAELLANSKWKK